MNKEIKAGEIYNLKQLKGYDFFKKLNESYRFVYRNNGKIYDAYGSGTDDNYIMITSIWSKTDRKKKESITLEDKL